MDLPGAGEEERHPQLDLAVEASIEERRCLQAAHGVQSGPCGLSWGRAVKQEGEVGRPADNGQTVHSSCLGSFPSEPLPFFK